MKNLSLFTIGILLLVTWGCSDSTSIGGVTNQYSDTLVAGSRAVVKRPLAREGLSGKVRLRFANGLESVLITAGSDFRAAYFDVPIDAESGAWAYVSDSSYEPLGKVLIVRPELHFPNIKVSLTGLRTFGSSGYWNKVISDTVIPVIFTATADQHSMLANTSTHWVLDYEVKYGWYYTRTNPFPTVLPILIWRIIR